MIRFLRKLGFTKQDLLIIGFLILTLLFGLVLKYSGWNNKKRFDYTESDNRFEQQLSSSFTDLANTSLTREQENKLNSLKTYSDSLIAEKEKSSVSSKTSKIEKKININLAYASELQLLPGIGEVMAERIIEYREQNNGFKKISDITKVKGIGQKKFEKIKDYITVD